MEARDCSGGFMSTTLHKAATHGDASLVAKALECTATNLDSVTAEGLTALMIAAGHGHLSVLTALCEAGADIEPCDSDGRNAEALALSSGHEQCALLLRAEAGSTRSEGEVSAALALRPRAVTACAARPRRTRPRAARAPTSIGRPRSRQTARPTSRSTSCASRPPTCGSARCG